MKYYYDLHIHSALSPCADNDMTPNNIVNMAVLKGLDVISITDHNSAKNVEVIYELCMSKGIKFIPGIEVQTKEEVHILCYFFDIFDCISFGKIVYDSLDCVKNNKYLFGEQLVMDKEDNIIDEEEKLLLTSCSFSVDDVFKMMDGIGAAVPAHVDRTSYSITSNLGFIPDIRNLKTIELSSNFTIPEDVSEYQKKYKIISSSDAHRLGDINERIHYIECNDFESIVEWLCS
ncbi:PHP domain-containing protein [Thermoanaerobacterium thermosaccharolyticum]|jgi:PHP domain.|uniref:PHP domain-containing protein n=1 Tax=Thermoanaerobacterium thermosaccharolyticum TaxID=1517 RepID=UPI0027A84435|nr:PHP domain-containing protein [Thermoanaerobacterium thermosaccharolyticum]